jgi:DNA repair exonuclease SbcCD nuclease subunit
VKVAVIADAHIGKSNDSKVLLDASEKFFTEVFFPRVRQPDIDWVVDLGDTLDRRKYVNFNTLHRFQRFFVQPMKDTEKQFVHLTGNHEVYHKYTNEVNAWHSIFGSETPHGWAFVNDRPMCEDGMDFIYLPWICESNLEAVGPAIERGGRVLFAHLDLDGFPVESGDVRQGGMDRKLFSKFRQVFSGHFHTQSRQDNVHYVGSVGQYTWGDYGDPRGFHVLDTETLETEFVRNPFDPFKKVFYDDSSDAEVERTMSSLKGLDGKFVKIVIKHKENPAAFDAAVDRVQKHTSDIAVVDAHHHQDVVPDVGVVPSESTLTILKRAAEEAPADVDRSRVLKILEELYCEAQDPDGN